MDVALELIGLPLTMQQALQVAGDVWAAVIVGLTDRTFEIAPYNDLLNKETEIIGASDHLARSCRCS